MNRLLFSLKTCQKSGTKFLIFFTHENYEGDRFPIFAQNKNFRFLTHSRDLGAILPPKWSYGRCASFLFSRNHWKSRWIWIFCSKNMKFGLKWDQIPENIFHPSIFHQKPAKPGIDPSCNGYQKIDLAQKPFRLLFPAIISLKSFWTGYFRPFRPFRPGTFTTLLNCAIWGHIGH